MNIQPGELAMREKNETFDRKFFCDLRNCYSMGLKDRTSPPTAMTRRRSFTPNSTQKHHKSVSRFGFLILTFKLELRKKTGTQWNTTSVCVVFECFSLSHSMNLFPWSRLVLDPNRDQIFRHKDWHFQEVESCDSEFLALFKREIFDKKTKTRWTRTSRTEWKKVCDIRGLFGCLHQCFLMPEFHKKMVNFKKFFDWNWAWNFLCAVLIDFVLSTVLYNNLFRLNAFWSVEVFRVFRLQVCSR